MAWFVCTLVVWLGAARPALAQQRVNGPYAGAFGARPDENLTQGLDLSGSMFGAYDLNVFPEPAGPDLLDPRLKESGASGGIAGSLTYNRRGGRAQFMLTGGGTARDYASSPDLAVVAYQAGTSLTVTVGSKLVLEARGGAGYSPFLQFAPFLDSGSGDPSGNMGPLGPGFGFAAAAGRNIGLDASVGLTSNVTKRTSVFATATGGDWRMLDAPENNLRTWGGRAGVRHRLGRGLGLHLEYGRGQHEYALVGGAPYVNQTIDAGVDYADTLSFARRATLSFSTSTSATHSIGRTHYRLNGSAQLTRAFRRTWSTWVGYNRDTEFKIGFREPLLTDSITAGLSGLVTLRAQWSMGAGYKRGTVGFGTNDFSTYIGTSRLDLALTRKLVVFGQYAYYHHDLPAGSSALDLVPRFSRQIATVGLSLSLPLVNHVRASNFQQP